MATLAPKGLGLQPHPLQAEIASTWHYWDAIGLWRREPPTPQQRQALARSCGSYWDREGSLEPARFDKRLVYRIDVKQPSEACLETLLEMESASPSHINHLQPARDECCTSRRAADRLKEFRQTHEIRLWHQPNQLLRHYVTSAGTDYDGGRTAPRMLTRYREQHSRHSGEADVVHSEFRLNGAQSVRRAGIDTIGDLLKFDHVAWWQAKTRLLTLPDFRRLGRMMRNQRDRTRDRASPIEVWQRGGVRLEFDMDWRRGYETWLACGVVPGVETSATNELQHLVDEFGVSRLVQAGVVEVIAWVHVGHDHSEATAKREANCEV